MSDGWWCGRSMRMDVCIVFGPYHIRYKCNCQVFGLFIVSFFCLRRIDIDAFLIGHRWFGEPNCPRCRRKETQLNMKMQDSSRRDTFNCVINMIPKNRHRPLCCRCVFKDKTKKKTDRETRMLWIEFYWISIDVCGTSIAATHRVHLIFIVSFINVCCGDI